MKIKKDYVLREVAGTNVVLPLGRANLSLNGMLTLNETAVLLWHMLEQGATSEALVDSLTKEYAVSVQDAKKDVEEFLNTLKQVDCLEN